jgi:ATP-dependent RNA helicase RhlE
MSFEQLDLIKPLVDAVRRKGYTTPTPIQQQSIPHILNGNDIFGCAQTGTGKTAAFALPLLQLLTEEQNQHIQRGIKVLILAPTRELVQQINESFAEYGRGTKIRHTSIYGGVSQRNQVTILKKGVDVVIATPGRLQDLVQQGFIKLDTVRHFVLDEADRMLDMGFIDDIKRIIAKLPAKKQTIFFAATLSPEIKKLSASLLHNPVSVSVAPVSSTSDLISQSVYYVKREDKKMLLKHVIQSNSVENALVFTRTKRGADKVAKDLNSSGIKAGAIHGDKSQNNREQTLKGFKKGMIRVLVATDVASRGIDIDKLSHVINYEIPEQAETYVHRIGRTGRAGAHGIALSFCTSDEKSYMKNIHKLIRKEISVVKLHPFQ